MFVPSHRRGDVYDIYTLRETIASHSVLLRTDCSTEEESLHQAAAYLSQLQLIPRRTSHIAPLWLFSCINLEERIQVRSRDTAEIKFEFLVVCYVHAGVG